MAREVVLDKCTACFIKNYAFYSPDCLAIYPTLNTTKTVQNCHPAHQPTGAFAAEINKHLRIEREDSKKPIQGK